MPTLRQICLKYGGKENKKQPFTEYEFKTVVGTLIVTDLKDNGFIPMIFEKDFDLQEFLRRTHDNSINHHSFKWNLHNSDKKFNLERLQARLEFFKNQQV